MMLISGNLKKFFSNFPNTAFLTPLIYNFLHYIIRHLIKESIYVHCIETDISKYIFFFHNGLKNHLKLNFMYSLLSIFYIYAILIFVVIPLHFNWQKKKSAHKPRVRMAPAQPSTHIL